MPRTVTVLISIGKTETGLWCDRCLLPSRVRVHLIMTTETGSSDTAISPVERCEECGAR